MVAIVYCDSEICFSQQRWEQTKDDMKSILKEEGIRVSYEAKIPMEHEKDEFDQILEQIKAKARSE